MHVERGVIAERRGIFDSVRMREEARIPRKDTSGGSQCAFYHSGDGARLTDSEI